MECPMKGTECHKKCVEFIGGTEEDHKLFWLIAECDCKGAGPEKMAGLLSKP
jgi:hypothetical protein